MRSGHQIWEINCDSGAPVTDMASLEQIETGGEDKFVKCGVQSGIQAERSLVILRLLCSNQHNVLQIVRYQFHLLFFLDSIFCYSFIISTASIPMIKIVSILEN
jgi:hypothetical protein